MSAHTRTLSDRVYRARMRVWEELDHWLDCIPSIRRLNGRWQFTRYGDWGCRSGVSDRWVRMMKRCDHGNGYDAVWRGRTGKICPRCGGFRATSLTGSLHSD